MNDSSCAFLNNRYSMCMSDTIVIPGDLKSCQTLIRELINTNAKQSEDIDSHKNKIDELTTEMEKLRKLLR